MKTLAAISTFSLLCAGCVVPPAGPVVYTPPPVYGRVDIGSYPPPLIYSQPVLVAPPRYVVQQGPIYLRVPPEHHHHWHRHCEQYGACDRPVYFVREPAAPAPAPGYGYPAARRDSERDARRWHHDEGGRSPGYRPLQPGDPRAR